MRGLSTPALICAELALNMADIVLLLAARFTVLTVAAAVAAGGPDGLGARADRTGVGGLGLVWQGRALERANEPGYACDAATCLPANDCMCPSTNNPGGLAPTETPQLVLITLDDSVDETAAAVRAVLGARANPNGCRLPATWFVLQDGTDPDLVSQLYQDGHEIATHTWSHIELRPGIPAKQLTSELLDVRSWLSAEAGIPESSLVGFRAPYLIHHPAQRQILYHAGFLYDSSLIEYFPSSLSPSIGQRVWPYTMDFGIPQDCGYTPDGECLQSERYPGFWEVPVWQLQDASGRKVYAMDPTARTADQLAATLVSSFEAAYQGNRAPFLIAVHPQWFTEKHSAALEQFIDYSLAKGDVHYVTMQQVIQWMRSPVPTSAMGTALVCTPGGTQQYASPAAGLAAAPTAASINATAPPLPEPAAAAAPPDAAAATVPDAAAAVMPDTATDMDAAPVAVASIAVNPPA